MMSALHMLCWTGLRPDTIFHEASPVSSEIFGSHAKKKREATQEWDLVQEHLIERCFSKIKI